MTTSAHGPVRGATMVIITFRPSRLTFFARNSVPILWERSNHSTCRWELMGLTENQFSKRQWQ
jgi:hypothetical protein